MKRNAVYYVMPIGEIWILRAIGSVAEAYPTFEDALAAAERVAARGGVVRVLGRAGEGPSLSKASDEAAARARAAS
jgi:hypothetical protein